MRGETIGAIGAGVLVLVGVALADEERDADTHSRTRSTNCASSTTTPGLMNRSLAETGGAALVVSQFTLLGDARRGRRPSFAGAARPELGRKLYERVRRARSARAASRVQTGEFGADMRVSSINDGPVTILLDTRKLF